MIEDMQYKRIAKDTLADGKCISTVWLGLDHRMDDGPPLIFESIVFRSKSDSRELETTRYSTEAEAIAGHAAMVARWSQKEKAKAP